MTKTIRRTVLVWIVILVSTVGPSAGAEPGAANAAPSGAAIPAAITLPAKVLRGYGELSAVFHNMKTADGAASLTRITCQSPQKALLVQAKYLSDVGLLPGSDADTIAVGTRSIPVRRAPAGGAVACCAAGRDVLILAAPSRKALASLIDRHVPPSIQPDAFAPHAQVPMYLDRFDKYGLLVYYGPWTKPPHQENYDYRVDFKFARDNKFGLILWQTPLPDDTAEGMNNEKAWDWIQEECRSLQVPLHLNLSFSWPMLWLGNRYREETMLKMIGKYHVPAAKVAILFGAGNEQIAGYPWRQNPAQFQPGGYWRVNPAMSLINYCARDAVTEEDFGTENVDKYRAIIDSNTSIVSEELLANLEKWVRAGGVFVTYGQTGRHTETEPDTWPIRRLSGYDVTAVADWGAGKQFQRTPTQTIYKNDAWVKPTRAAGIQLGRAAAECRDLLVWSDGTVAAGLRPLGAGWVVTLGPTVGGGDVGKLLAPILEHFNAANLVPAHASLPAFNLYTRHYVSNTGLHDVWVMYNETGKPITTDLVFLPGFRPASFADVVTDRSLEITRDPAGDKVRNITLGILETRMWISPRQETAASPLEWLSVQRNWWAGAAAPDPTPLPTPAENQRFTVDLTNDWTFKPADGLTDDESAALVQPAVDDSAWEKRDLGIWSLPDHPNVKHAVTRRKFTVPSGWTSGYVGLCVAQHTGVFVDGGRIFMDGQALRPAFYRDGIYLDPAKGLLKPGTSHVLALDIKSKQSVAGSRGNAWIYYIPEPQQRQSLSGDWQRYTNPLQAAGKVQLPGPFQGQYATRTVVIDRAHANQNVLIHVDGMAVEGVMVNGKLINRSRRVYNSIFSINVTPYVNFGQENLIELVVRPDPQPTPIKVVEIRYYDKGV